ACHLISLPLHCHPFPHLTPYTSLFLSGRHLVRVVLVRLPARRGRRRRPVRPARRPGRPRPGLGLERPLLLGLQRGELVRPHARRSEEHTSELQSPYDLVCRILLHKKNN